MPSEFQYDVFLSHSSKDKAVVGPANGTLRGKRRQARRTSNAIATAGRHRTSRSVWSAAICRRFGFAIQGKVGQRPVVRQSFRLRGATAADAILIGQGGHFGPHNHSSPRHPGCCKKIEFPVCSSFLARQM